MAIFFYEQRLHYNSFVRTVEKRKSEEDEFGTFDIDSDFPHAAAMPPMLKGELPVDLQAGAQMAAAALYKKAGRKIPSWVTHAFGRATALKASSPLGLAVDHRKAFVFVQKQKRTLKDVLGNTLADEEALVLRASFLEYLAYSGKTARFPQFTKAFKVNEDGTDPTVERALRGADYIFEKLDTAWQGWVRTMK